MVNLIGYIFGFKNFSLELMGVKKMTKNRFGGQKCGFLGVKPRRDFGRFYITLKRALGPYDFRRKTFSPNLSDQFS